MISKEIKALTSLRFFAATAIVFFHMGFHGTLPFYVPGVVTQGVSFFFVLSGFILAYVHGHRSRWGGFYLNRFARLWPVHALCFILYITLINSTMMLNPKWWNVAALNLAMVHAWVPFAGVAFSFNAVSWSISCEFAFYLLFPLLLMIRPTWMMWLFCAVLAAWTVYLAEVIPRPDPPILFATLPRHIVMQHPAARLLEFATGIATARTLEHFVHRDMRRQWWTAAEIAILAILLLYWQQVPAVKGYLSQHGLAMTGAWFSQSSGMLFFAAAITIFAKGDGLLNAVLSTSPMVKLGEISFATYMIHPMVITLYQRSELNLGVGAGSVVILSVVYGLSYLIYTFYEEPMRAWITGRRRTPAPPSAQATP